MFPPARGGGLWRVSRAGGDGGVAMWRAAVAGQAAAAGRVVSRQASTAPATPPTTPDPGPRLCRRLCCPLRSCLCRQLRRRLRLLKHANDGAKTLVGNQMLELKLRTSHRGGVMVFKPL